MILLTAIAIWGIGQTVSTQDQSGQLKTEKPSPWQSFEPQASGVGTDEDPFARLRYRWMRLRNPKTGRIPEDIREKELVFAKSMRTGVNRKTSSWAPRGPANVGGRSRAVSYDRTDTNGETILAAGASGGMWRTTDGGQTWNRTFTKSQRPNVTTVIQDPRTGKEDVWYAGTGEYYGTASYTARGAFYRGDGIYKSTDGGQTWSPLSNTTSEETDFDSVFDYVYRVRVDPSNTTNDEIYAATYGGIQRSTDGGSSWTTVLSGLSGDQTSITDLAVTTSGVVYATMSSDGDTRGLYRSTDGTNWTEITPSGWPSGQDTYFRTVVDINPSDESEVWFLSNAPGYGPVGADGQGDKIGHILWRYDADAPSGSRWTDFSDYLPTRGDNDDNVNDGKYTGDFNSQEGYDLLVAVHPSDPSKVFVGGRNLWRLDVSGSSTGADTWIGGYTHQNDSYADYNPSESDPHHPDQHTLEFHPTDGDQMLVGSDGGIHETTDNRATGDGGVTYTDLNDGYVTTQFYQVCLNPDDSDDTILGGMQDNGTWGIKTTSTSDDWTELLGGDGAECEIANRQSASGVVRYPSSQNGNVVQAVYDANGNLLSSASATPSGASGQLFIHPFDLDPADPTVMYYPGGTSLWRNTDVEGTPSSGWTELTGATQSGYVITSVRASVSSSKHVLYYGATDADGDGTREPARLFRVDNANSVPASNFSRNELPTSGATTFPDGGYVSDIAVDPTDSDKVLVAISNYDVVSLFYSSDGGQSWTDVEGTLGGTTGPSVRSVEILPQPALGQTTYYAATSVGLYSTTSLSSSTTWDPEGGSSIGNVVVEDVEARNSDGLVLVGTHGNGVYTSSVTVPVELAQFEADTDGSAVELTWATASEANNAGFEVRHRYRNEPWEDAGFVEGGGTTGQPNTYRFRFKDLSPGQHTFRLQQVDTDGSATQLKTRTVTISPAGAYELTKPSPNPFATSSNLRLTVDQTQHVRAVLYNTIGQQVKTPLDRTLSANRPVDVSIEGRDLSSGIYFLQVRGETFDATRQIVVAR
ncbi:hypothetical protein BSZ35_18215 [Salinibacter sp. 10B]|nr:hypothetical protein BSZ35_18215 [Salinibacter sp. 10B]